MKRLLIIISILIVSINTFAYDTTTLNRELVRAAKKGDPDAIFHLGVCYYNGRGVLQNYENAVQLYLRAAELGHPQAMSWLGYCYDEGNGVSQNYEKAVEWYRKAAELGDAEAMNNLGYCYDVGNGVIQNYTKAVEWYRKAAELGDTTAMVNLGNCYEEGNGVAPDYEMAIEWYRKAADKGDSEAIKTIESLLNQPKKINSKEFPVLDIQKVEFADNGNNLIEAGEKCRICVTILNSGNGEASGCILKATSSASGIMVSEVKLPSIPAGKSMTRTIEVNADLNTIDGEADFKIEIEEPNGMGPDPTLLTVSTQAFQAPNVLVSDYSITSENGGMLQKRVPFDLQVLVQNLAKGKAEDVEVLISVPKNIFIVEGNLSNPIGTLSGGETKELDYSLVVNNNYTASTIPVTINLKEKHGKYAESKTINLQLNQTLAQNKIVVKAENKPEPNNIELAQIKGKVQQAEVDINIPTTDIKNENTFAVFIGNENYKNEIRVPFAMNDATVMARYFNSALGLPLENIRIATDATRNEIVAQIDWLRKVTKAFNGGNVIVYYSGHGMPDENSSSPMLIPVDGYSTNKSTCYELKTLYEELASMGADNVTVIIDACFSGADRGDGMLLAAKGVRIKADNALQLPGSMVVLSASQGDETAFPYLEKSHGMFTYYLLKKLQDSNGKASLGEISDYVTRQVEQRSILVNNKSQTPATVVSPSLQGSWREMRWQNIDKR